MNGIWLYIEAAVFYENVYDIENCAEVEIDANSFFDGEMRES